MQSLTLHRNSLKFFHLSSTIIDTCYKDRRSTANTKTHPSLALARFSGRLRISLGSLICFGMSLPFCFQRPRGRIFWCSKSFRKSGKFAYEHRTIISLKLIYPAALVKDTVVSMHGRSRTSASLDLEIDEESKNVRKYYALILVYEWIDFFLPQSVSSDTQSDSPRQASEQPSKKNVGNLNLAKKSGLQKTVAHSFGRKSSKPSKELHVKSSQYQLKQYRRSQRHQQCRISPASI